MKTSQLVYIISQMGHFTQKLVSLEWPGYDIVCVNSTRGSMPIGQFSGAVCKMYVRRRANSKRLCTQESRPIIISGVLFALVYFQIGAIWRQGDVFAGAIDRRFMFL